MAAPPPVLDPQDREAAELTRRVMNLAVIFVFLSMVQCIQEMDSGAADALWWLMVSLAMPYCGYYGAKNKDRNLLCMFYSINLAVAILYMLTVLLMMIIITNIDPAVERCHEGQAETALEADVRLDTSAVDPEDTSTAAAAGGDGGPTHPGQPMDAETCAYWEAQAEHKAHYYMQMLVHLCRVFLHCAAFSNGKRLACLPNFGLERPAGASVYRDGSPAATVTGNSGYDRRLMMQQRRRMAAQQDDGVIHAQVVQAVPVPVDLPCPVQPQLRPGEVQAGAVFEVETTANPTAGGGSELPVTMGEVVMGSVVADSSPTPAAGAARPT